MLTVLAPARHARLQRHGAPTTSGSGASPAPAATALSSLLDRPFTLLETTLDLCLVSRSPGVAGVKGRPVVGWTVVTK